MKRDAFKLAEVRFNALAASPPPELARFYEIDCAQRLDEGDGDDGAASGGRVGNAAKGGAKGGDGEKQQHGKKDGRSEERRVGKEC